MWYTKTTTLLTSQHPRSPMDRRGRILTSGGWTLSGRFTLHCLKKATNFFYYRLNPNHNPPPKWNSIDKNFGKVDRRSHAGKYNLVNGIPRYVRVLAYPNRILLIHWSSIAFVSFVCVCLYGVCFVETTSVALEFVLEDSWVDGDRTTQQIQS